MRMLTLVLFAFTLACNGSTQPANTAQANSQPQAQKPAEPPKEEVIENATAVFDTTAGELRCELFGKQTPKTVANFVGLAEGTKPWKHPASGARKEGVPLYNGTVFHRVIPNFMIQGGDPAGNGTGDPGYMFEDEIVSSLKFDRPGRLAMANSGPNTNGSQFFITEVPTPHLNGKHTIFGQCDRSTMELVKKIARRPTDPRTDRPFTAVKINKITIIREGDKPAEQAGAPKTDEKPKQ